MINVIEAYKVVGTPFVMDGPRKETFFYEEGEDYAIDSEGVYHRIADVDTDEELRESACLGYSNGEGFFTYYAEDGNYKNMLHSMSEEMKQLMQKTFPSNEDNAKNISLKRRLGWRN